MHANSPRISENNGSNLKQLVMTVFVCPLLETREHIRKFQNPSLLLMRYPGYRAPAQLERPPIQTNFLVP